MFRFMQISRKGLGTFIFALMLSFSMLPVIGAGCDSLGQFFKATMSGKKPENALRFVKLEKADEVFESKDGTYTPIKITGLDEDGSLLYRRGGSLDDNILRMDIDGDEFANLVESIPPVVPGNLPALRPGTGFTMVDPPRAEGAGAIVTRAEDAAPAIRNSRLDSPDLPDRSSIIAPDGGRALPATRATTDVTTFEPPAATGSVDDVVIPRAGAELPARGDVPRLSAPEMDSSPRVVDDGPSVIRTDIDAPLDTVRTGPPKIDEPPVPVSRDSGETLTLRAGNATDEVLDGSADGATATNRLVAGSGDVPAPSTLGRAVEAVRPFRNSFERFELGDLITFTSPAGRNTTSGRLVRVNGRSVVLEVNGVEKNIPYSRINLDSITKAPSRDLIKLELDIPAAPGTKFPVSFADEANLPAGTNVFKTFSEDLTSKLRTGNFSIVGPDGVRIDNVRLVKTYIENGEEVHIYKKIGDGAEELITVYPARDMLIADITEIAADGTGILRYRQTSPTVRAAGSTDVAHVPTPLSDEAVELLESSNPRPSWIERRKTQIRSYRDLIGENLKINFKPGRAADMASSVADMLRRGARFLGDVKDPAGRMFYRFKLANGRVIRVVPDAINGTRLVSRPFDSDDSSPTVNDEPPTPNPHPDIVEPVRETDDGATDDGATDDSATDGGETDGGETDGGDDLPKYDPNTETVVGDDNEERIPLPSAASGNPVGPSAIPGAQMNIIIKKGGY